MLQLWLLLSWKDICSSIGLEVCSDYSIVFCDLSIVNVGGVPSNIFDICTSNHVFICEIWDKFTKFFLPVYNGPTAVIRPHPFAL